MDAGLLTADPITVTLTKGTLTGRASVDHRQGPPKLMIDVAIKGARLGSLLKGQADAPLSGHVRLSGSGNTVRGAIAGGEGEVVLVARNGRIKTSTAQFLGENVSGGVSAGGDEMTGLNCVIVRMKGSGGRYNADPFVIDTDVSRADLTGGVTMATEAIDLRMAGSAKTARAIRLPAPIEIGGTLAKPDIGLAPIKGGLFGKIGRALGIGKHAPDTPAADCAALASRVR